MDCGNVDQHLIKMAVLGRRFQLGDLYNYRTDHILTESRCCWNSADLASATSRDIGFKLKLLCPDSDTSHKWQHMKLDEHLQASILAGLLDKLRGASQYVSEKSNPTQVSRTFICRTRNKNERVDLPTLLGRDVPTISNDEKLAGATHVVVGITYGAEAYCVLAQDVDENNEDAREETAEYLAQISSKMQNAMEDKLDAAEFKEQFDNEEKKLVSQIKCRVYADLQTQPVRECSLFEAYKHCMKLVEVMTSNNEKAIPVVAILCPLEIVRNAKGNFEKTFDYREVNDELVARCCSISTELERVISRSNSLRLTFKKSISPALRQFVEVVSKFRDLIKSSWKRGIIMARENENEDDEVEKATNIAETHSIFKISRLNRWLRFKRAALEMVIKLDSVNGITFFANEIQLENKLADSLDKKFTLVLYIPQLDEWTEDMLSDMKDYVDSNTSLVAGDADDDDQSDDDGDEKELPWHMVTRKKKQVMGKIREMADHVEKNRHLKNQVQFFISTQEIDKKLGCRFSVYQADNLVKDNITQLPSTAPTGLRIQLDTKRPKMSAIHLTWDYEDLGYPCTFLVEYRPKDDPEEIWKQKKTSNPGETRTTIILGQDSDVFEFRVAAETCIGRSEFSKIVDNTESATEGNIQPSQKRIGLQPPTKLFVDSVTQTTAELVWTPPTNSAKDVAFSYSILYWQNGQRLSVHIGVDSSRTSLRLEDLKPGATYSIVVIAETEDGQQSASSNVIKFTTSRPKVSTPVVPAQSADSAVIDRQKITRNSTSDPTKKLDGAKSSQIGPLNEKLKESTECLVKRTTRKRGIGEIILKSNNNKELEESPFVESKKKLMEMPAVVDRLKTKASRPLLEGEAKIAMEKKWFHTIETTNVNVKAIEDLILNGADVNAKTFMGRTALHEVCQLCQNENLVDIVRLLIEKGVEINAKDCHGYTALHLFCGTDKTENIIITVVRVLVENGVDILAKGVEERTVLHSLCENCKIEDPLDVVRFLVENGVDVNEKTRTGLTALHFLCMNDKIRNLLDVVLYLVGKGAEVIAKDEGINGWTAFHYLCQYHHNENSIDIVRLFFEKGIDVRAKVDGEYTALHLLCQNEKNGNLLDIARFLVEQKVDVNEKDFEEKTALHYLGQNDNNGNLLDVTRFLVQQKVDVNAKDNEGMTALHYFCESVISRDLFDVVRLLVENGADLNAKDENQGRTAIHHYLWHTRKCEIVQTEHLIDVLQLFSENGGDVTAKDGRDWTALHILCDYCVSENQVDILRLFIEKGVDVNAKDREGKTALHFLCQNTPNRNIFDVAQLLVENGADVNAKDNKGRTPRDGITCKKDIPKEILKILVYGYL